MNAVHKMLAAAGGVATGAVHQGEAPSEFVIGILQHGGLKPLMRKIVLGELPKRSTIGG